MAQKLVIIGAEFAGMYAALSAARRRDASCASTRGLEVALVEPTLMIPPRLYDPNPEIDREPVTDL